MKNRILLLAAGAAFVWAGCGEQSSPMNPTGEGVVRAAGAGGGASTQQVVDPAGFVCETIDFNVAGDGTGTRISSITAAGVTFDVTVSGATGHLFPPSTTNAMLYDTDPPIGADSDLESTGICGACAGLDEILVIEDAGGPAAEGDSDGGGIITLDNFSPAGTFRIIEFLAVDDDDGPFALVVDGTETARSTSLGDGTVETIAPSTPDFNTSADFWLGIASAPGVTPRVGKRASGGFDNIRFCVQCTASVGDFVWNDVNMNGIQDGGELGIAGVTVTLYAADGVTVLATTTTDANGFYSFTNLCPGTYQVGVTPPAGFVASPTNQGGDPTLDSNPNPDPVTLANGETNLTYDFGFYMPPTGGGEGCTPGYWKNHAGIYSNGRGNQSKPSAWVGYHPLDSFDATFGVTSSFGGNLIEALNRGGGGENALGRHAVAALLNAASSVSYDLTEAEVIALVQNAYATGDFNGAKNILAGFNEQGCPLN